MGKPNEKISKIECENKRLKNIIEVELIRSTNKDTKTKKFNFEEHQSGFDPFQSEENLSFLRNLIRELLDQHEALKPFD
jgi:hypothetical protein